MQPWRKFNVDMPTSTKKMQPRVKLARHGADVIAKCFNSTNHIVRSVDMQGHLFLESPFICWV